MIYKAGNLLFVIQNGPLSYLQLQKHLKNYQYLKYNMFQFQMNLDKNPYEAGLGPFVKTNKKTSFIGQEACKELLGKDLKSKLVALTVDTHGHLDPEGNETIWFDNKVNIQEFKPV